MSQSSAILTLHRRTGGDTEGGRAIARQTPRARGAPRLLRRKRGVTARASRPGPASKLPSLGRRGLAEALRAPRGGGGACLFLKSGVRAGGWSLGGDRRRRPAAEGGQPMLELGQERGKWGCPAGGRGLHAARRSPPWRRRPRDPGLRAGGGGRARGLQLCRRGRARGRGAAGGAARQLLRPGRPGRGVRVYVRSPPRSPRLRGPHRRPAAPCAAPARRVCAATQLARGPRPPGRGPGRKTLSSRLARRGGGGGDSVLRLLLRRRETWCPGGPACVTEPRPRRRREGLARAAGTWRGSPFPTSCQCARQSGQGNCARAGSLGEQTCRGGGELGQVQQRPKLERLGRAGGPASPRAPRRCGRTSDLSSFSPAPARPRLCGLPSSPRASPRAVFVGARPELGGPGFVWSPHMAGLVEVVISSQLRLTGACAPGCSLLGAPHPSLWLRAWCRPGILKPQPQGRQTWRKYLPPAKVEAPGYSSPASRASCWKGERGS